MAILLIFLVFGTVSNAAETTTYACDAKGRLMKVVKSGGPNSGSSTAYINDKSDNRVRVTIRGLSR
jgi:YD repeat-containing protein